LVDNAPPIDILKMAVLTSADKADRRDTPALSVVATIVEALRGFQLLEAHKPPPVRGVARGRVADEPTWKNGCSDLGRCPARVAHIEGRRPQLRIAARRQPTIILQPQTEQS
jgi:hypothetical protein